MNLWFYLSKSGAWTFSENENELLLSRAKNRVNKIRILWKSVCEVEVDPKLYGQSGNSKFPPIRAL